MFWVPREEERTSGARIYDLLFPLHPSPPFPSRPSGRGEWLRGRMGLDVKDRPPVGLPGFCFKNTMKKGEFEHPKDAKNSALLAGSPLGR